MSKQLAGGFDKVKRLQLTIEEFEALNSKSNNNAIYHHQNIPLLKNTHCAHVATEQVKHYAHEQHKETINVERQVSHLSKTLVEEKQKAQIHENTSLITFLGNQLEKLETVNKDIQEVNKKLQAACQKARKASDKVQEQVSTLYKSQRCFEKGIQDYIENELENITLLSVDNKPFSLSIPPNILKDLSFYLKDNRAIEQLLEKSSTKVHLRSKAELLKQQKGISTLNVESFLEAHVRGDFRKEEIIKQLARKQVVILSTLRKALEEKYPELLADQAIEEQLNEVVNSDALFNVFMAFMSTQYDTEIQLAHNEAVANEVMSQALQS